MSGAANEASSEVRQLATIAALPQQRKLMAERGRLTKRRKWWSSLAAAIKATGKGLGAAVAARRRDEEARKAIEERTKAEPAREIAQAQTQAVAKQAAIRQTADAARLKTVESPRKANEEKPKSDAEVRAHRPRGRKST